MALKQDIDLEEDECTNLRIVQEAAWEKLHTGAWKDVHMSWRDLYSLGCLLLSLADLAILDRNPSLPPAASADSHAAMKCEHSSGTDAVQAVAGACSADTEQSQPGDSCRGSSSTEQARLAGAMRELDMAVIMGGLRFRPWVDAAIQLVQQRHLQLARLDPPVGGRTDAEEEQRAASKDPAPCSDSAEPERPSKYRRTLPNGDSHRDEAASEMPMAGGHDRGLMEECWPKGTVDPAQLPAGSLRHGSSVRAEELPSLERFFIECMCSPGGGKPCLISGAMQHWPAMAKWQQPGYLKQVAGLRTVPIELGDHYLQDGWGQSLMPLGDFIAQHVMRVDAPLLEESQGFERRRGYLAQHPLFEQIPELKRDILEPEYCSLGEGEMQSVNAWFGPAGTVTPLHCDPHHNLLAQVVGAKYVRLYPPSATPQLYPFEEGLTTNSSQVDLDAPDLDRFPEFDGLPFQDTILSEGQMLYIPPKWWHYVRAVSVSFSVSFWWK